MLLVLKKVNCKDSVAFTRFLLFVTHIQLSLKGQYKVQMLSYY